MRALPDVQDAIGGVSSESAQLVKDGKTIAFGGAPNLGFSVDPTRPQFNSLTLVQGAWPGPNEVVVDKSTADKKDLAPGQTIGVQVEGPLEQLRISGLVKFGAVSSIGGATLAGFDLATAQRLFDKEGKLDQIRAAAKPGVAPAKLIEQIREILPPNTEVRTGDAQAQEDAKSTDEFISFLRYFLLAFGLIALFVGAFVIVNSLSITIAQRTRELATLRTLGASRRQVRVSVVLEALVMGVLASIVGLFLGLGLAKGLFALFDAVGFTLPNNGILLETRTIVVSLALGIIVTLIASFFPALRATRVPPIAAVREGAELPPGRFHRFRTPFAALITALGFALLVLGLFSHGTSTVLILLISGPCSSSSASPCSPPRSSRPSPGSSAGRRRKIGGAAGTLARDNARRNPQRTASTAAALMIGLALVTLVATLAAGHHPDVPRRRERHLRRRLRDHGAEQLLADPDLRRPEGREVSRGDGGGQRPHRRLARVRRAAVHDRGHARRAGRHLARSGRRALSRRWRTSAQNGAFVDDGFAKDHNLTVGSSVPVTFITGKTRTFQVKGIFDPPTGGSPFGPVTVSAATWDAENPQPQDLYTFVKIAGGESDANVAALEKTLSGYPNAKVQTQAAVHRQPDLGPELDPEHPLRAARALGDREPVRDREHARAHRVRADAGDRDAARDRAHPTADAADDPARERHHRADRRVHRDRARA